MIILRTQIRRVENSELDQLADIWNEHTNLITTSKLVVSQTGLIKFRSENPNLEYFGAFSIQDNRLLGFIAIWKESDGYYINQIALTVDYQGYKIGRALVEYSIELSKMKNFENLKLSVMVINIKALNFFLKIGFEIEDYYVEKDYIPKNYTDTFKDQLRLVEYKMIYKIK